MNTNLAECPNCNAPLKGGFLSSVTLLDSEKTALINAVNNTQAPAHCTKCGDKLFSDARNRAVDEIEVVKKEIYETMKLMPVISAQNPLNWDYHVLNMVTGQSTTGTGVFSEFFSSWTDLFGAQSGSYNSKIKAGELLCYQQLRKQTLDLGGNAVIATDIDYSEMGGDKAMIMVCMAGTAVRVKNLDIFGETRRKALEDLATLSKRLKTMQLLVYNTQK